MTDRTSGFTQKEIAAKFRVTERTVYNWRKSGKAEAVKVTSRTIRILRIHPDKDRAA